MRKIKSPLVVAIASGLLAGTAIGVAAQEDASGGYTFKRLAPLSENEQIGLQGVAELASGEIAVIAGGPDGYLAFASHDDGESWIETQLDAFRIVAHGDAFVAVGGSGFYDEAKSSQVYTSADGVTWDQIGTLDGAVINSLVNTPDGLAMIGLDFREAEGWGDTLAGYPTLWQSSDAVTWEAQEIREPMYAKGHEIDDAVGLSDLARSADGQWLATGVTNNWNEEQEGPPGKSFHVYHSVDGVTWTQATAPVSDSAPGHFGTMNQPLSTETGFLINAFSGVEGEPAGLFTTVNGSEWEQVADIPGPDFSVLAANGPTVVGFRLPLSEGEDPPSLLDASPMYVSPNGSTWEHPTPFSFDDAVVHAASFSPDGALLLAGADITGCREFFCVFAPGNGSDPAVWIGEPN